MKRLIVFLILSLTLAACEKEVKGCKCTEVHEIFDFVEHSNGTSTLEWAVYYVSELPSNDCNQAAADYESTGIGKRKKIICN